MVSAVRRKYSDCQREDGNCSVCPLVNYGLDCHNRQITKLEWYRRGAELTQKGLADKAGINIRLVQKIESGEYKAENLAAKNLVSIADALGVDPHDLI